MPSLPRRYIENGQSRKHQQSVLPHCRVVKPRDSVLGSKAMLEFPVSGVNGWVYLSALLSTDRKAQPRLCVYPTHNSGIQVKMVVEILGIRHSSVRVPPTFVRIPRLPPVLRRRTSSPGRTGRRAAPFRAAWWSRCGPRWRRWDAPKRCRSR